jgi:hypothetical protein
MEKTPQQINVYSFQVDILKYLSFHARNEQLTVCIDETAGPRSKISGIKPGCFPKGGSANVLLNDVSGIKKRTAPFS